MTDTMFAIQLHNKLCEVADLFLYSYDPCEFVNDKCKRGQPCCSSGGTPYEKKDNEAGCLFLTDKGCGVKNILCKLGFCFEVYDHIDSKFKRAFKALEIIARIYKLSTFSPEHFRPEKDEYQTDDLLRNFND